MTKNIEKYKKKFSLLSKINNGVLMLSHSKYFSGLMMVMLNVGSKYITIELSDSQKTY